MPGPGALTGGLPFIAAFSGFSTPAAQSTLAWSPAAVLARILAIAAKVNRTGVPERTSRNVAAILYGRPGTAYYLNRTDVAAGWDVFDRFADKDWSFTDWTSKVVMESLGIGQAFGFDRHFRQFGTVAVVP